jgi:hypothetical protein
LQKEKELNFQKLVPLALHQDHGRKLSLAASNVVDPELYGHPGSGSVIILYGSGSFHQQAKVRKALISTLLTSF